MKMIDQRAQEKYHIWNQLEVMGQDAEVAGKGEISEKKGLNNEGQRDLKTESRNG